jgi:hypothetical protein
MKAYLRKWILLRWDDIRLLDSAREKLKSD